jgi:large subunit ribosomal protein L14
MIQNGTHLNVIDNSGAKNVCCIRVSKGYKRRYASIGDVIVVSVKNLRKRRRITSKVRKGDVVKALIIRTRSSKNTGFYEQLNFKNNGVILITQQNKPIGTRIFGAIPRIFKYTKFLRITSLSSGLIK